MREMSNTTVFLLFDNAEQWKVPILLTDACFYDQSSCVKNCSRKSFCSVLVGIT
jgi:hypothetical protein